MHTSLIDLQYIMDCIWGVITCFIGKSLEDGLNQNGKSILMMSTPHSGRTTLLQGMMNFIFGVSSNDDFRLCFAPEILNMVWHPTVTYSNK